MAEKKKQVRGTRVGELRKTEEQKQDREETQGKKAVKDALLKRDINATFSTPEGRRTLHWLKSVCGYDRSGLSMDLATQELNVQTTLARSYRREVYLEIRQYIKPKTLAEVENKDLANTPEGN